jgi:hypothetical protein
LPLPNSFKDAILASAGNSGRGPAANEDRAMLNIYLPFNDDDLLRGAGGFVAEDGSDKNIHIHGTPSASPGGVSEKPTLFVMAHGLN